MTDDAEILGIQPPRVAGPKPPLATEKPAWPIVEKIRCIKGNTLWVILGKLGIVSIGDVFDPINVEMSPADIPALIATLESIQEAAKEGEVPRSLEHEDADGDTVKIWHHGDGQAIVVEVLGTRESLTICTDSADTFLEQFKAVLESARAARGEIR